MDIRKLLMTNSNGEKSTTVTAFWLGFFIVGFKLVASGMTISGITFSEFSGTEYGIALGALGAIYVMRRGQVNKEEEDK